MKLIFSYGLGVTRRTDSTVIWFPLSRKTGKLPASTKQKSSCHFIDFFFFFNCMAGSMNDNLNIVSLMYGITYAQQIKK